MALKYKVGDKVRIKSLDWYNENKDEYGQVDCGSRFFFAEMSDWCGKIATIKEICKTNCYRLEECYLDWTDEMIEGLVEEEVFIKANDIYNEEYSKGEYCHEQSFKWGFQEGYNYSHENDKLEISLKEGYQFKDENGNVINATKIVLEKKKKAYPKTYEECAEVLCECAIMTHGYKRDLLNALQKLLICRDAYWKIAGEEMGLGKPWEPDWTNEEWPDMAYISYDGKSIDKENGFPCCNMILIFPYEEMRDAFYENFKELIEQCKELL